MKSLSAPSLTSEPDQYVQPTLFVIGSANVDHIMKVKGLPSIGETVTNGRYLRTFGGKGANCAVAAAKAGGQVEFIACLGDDAGGRDLLASLHDFGVRTTHLDVLPGEMTGHALIMVGEGGENYLTVSPGTNGAFLPGRVEKLAAALPCGSRVLLQNELPVETNLALLRLAKQRSLRIFYNFAPALPFPLDYLARIELLIVNSQEADALLNAAGCSTSTAEETAEELRKLGPTGVIITLGGEGVIAATSEGIVRFSAIKVKAVDTTAAGDTFCGVLAVALSEDRSLSEAIRMANVAAAISVTRPGSMVSSPTRTEIENHLNDA